MGLFIYNNNLVINALTLIKNSSNILALLYVLLNSEWIQIVVMLLGSFIARAKVCNHFVTFCSQNTPAPYTGKKDPATAAARAIPLQNAPCFCASVTNNFAKNNAIRYLYPGKRPQTVAAQGFTICAKCYP